MNYEIVGVLATIFVVLGFACDGEENIRKFDMVGAILFVIYGSLIKSFSNILLNAILISIHVYKMFKLRRERNENKNSKTTGDVKQSS